jgi:hypothetical protein
MTKENLLKRIKDLENAEIESATNPFALSQLKEIKSILVLALKGLNAEILEKAVERYEGEGWDASGNYLLEALESFRKESKS